MTLPGALAKRALAVAAPHLVVSRGSAEVPALCLTFDDGPHPENTPRVLQALADAQAQATFFLQGSEARRWPQLVRAIHEQGHQVANHAATHRKPREIGTHAYVKEVVDTHALLCDIVGEALPRSFRPPFGDTSLATLARLIRAGFQYVFWSRDSRDSWLKDPAALLADMALHRPRAGDIVLFHDDYPQTAAALPELLGTLREAGLRPVRVDGLT
ncbi:MAG: polysaccharide deacetylase family protein [Pseudomonadota bacterium]